jgi:peptide/nickel transport system permease protein
MLPVEEIKRPIIVNQEEEDNFELNQIILTPGQLIMKRFFRNKLAVLGLCIILAISTFCFVGPMFSEYGEYEIFYINQSTGEEIRMVETDKLNGKNVGVNVKAPISSSHGLGTDADGRDVLTRLMYGGRISLIFSVVVTFIELLLGVVLGGIAGYYGGKIDMLIMRLVDIFYCIPFFPLMLVTASLMSAFGVRPQSKIYFLMVIMGVFNWSGVARLVRGQILSIREMDYMQAAEACGLSVYRKIFKHLIPNVTPVIIVLATMDLGGFILSESALSYLGVGLSFPYASLGNMVNAVNSSIIMKNYLNIWLPPGLLILFIVMAFNFIGDGLRDAFDPKMKR